MEDAINDLNFQFRDYNCLELWICLWYMIVCIIFLFVVFYLIIIKEFLHLEVGETIYILI